MNDCEYQALINDTLTHIRGLLPPIKEEKAPIAPLPKPPKPKTPPTIPLKPKPPKPIVESPPKKPENLETEPFIKIESPKALPPELTGDIRKILHEIDPNLYIHDTIPSDSKAKRIKEAWKEKRSTPSIPILFQKTHYQGFLASIAKAVDTVYGSCRLVEMTPNKKWDLFLESENLRLIIIPDTLIFGSKELLPFYQETPQQNVRTLGNIPLLLLPDLSLYYKDPYLKRSLWNVLCNTLDSLPLS